MCIRDRSNSVPDKPKTNATSTVHITHDDISIDTLLPENNIAKVEMTSDANVTVKSVIQRNNTNEKSNLANTGSKPPVQVTAITNNKRAIRIFVALFDYDPLTMSPNPDACDEELPFREGQLIKVHGDKDADGFYWGEAGNKSGFVPCNMVSEVQVEDDRVAEELFREQSDTSRGVDTSSLRNWSSPKIIKSLKHI